MFDKASFIYLLVNRFEFIEIFSYNFYEDYNLFLKYFVIIFCLSILLFYIGYMNTKTMKIQDDEKISAYQSGFEPIDHAKNNFNIQHFHIAILFLIFEIELIFLLFWILTFRSQYKLFLNFFYLIIIFYFFYLLIFGFLYEYLYHSIDI